MLCSVDFSHLGFDPDPTDLSVNVVWLHWLHWNYHKHFRVTETCIYLITLVAQLWAFQKSLKKERYGWLSPCLCDSFLNSKSVCCWPVVRISVYLSGCLYWRLKVFVLNAHSGWLSLVLQPVWVALRFLCLVTRFFSLFMNPLTDFIVSLKLIWIYLSVCGWME